MLLLEHWDSWGYSRPLVSPSKIAWRQLQTGSKGWEAMPRHGTHVLGHLQDVLFVGSYSSPLPLWTGIRVLNGILQPTFQLQTLTSQVDTSC